MAANYCLQCGHALENRSIGGMERRACPACDFVFWGDYSIGVGALVIKDNQVLLVRRAQNPGKGYWTNPGGYCEQLEAIQSTIQREVLEEAGVFAEVRSILAIRDQPRTIHNLYLAFSMQFIEGDPRPDGLEVDGAGFFSHEEMENLNVAPFTRWLVDVALNGAGDGLLQDSEPIVELPGNHLFRVQKKMTRASRVL